ncbi:hypothetical protein HDU93_005893 [Gonapodya sp. JEL0774]|nr:hypothetical protein HDU93_005893 [Gonapodya sp. JEL0774]
MSGVLPTYDEWEHPYQMAGAEVLGSLIEMGAITNSFVTLYFIDKMRQDRKKNKYHRVDLQTIIASTCISADMVSLLVRFFVKGFILFRGGPPVVSGLECQLLALSSVIPWGGTILGYAQLALERYDALYLSNSTVILTEAERASRGYLGMSRKTAISVLIGGYCISLVMGTCYLVRGYVLSPGGLTCQFRFWSSTYIDIIYTTVTLMGVLGAIAAIAFSAAEIVVQARAPDRLDDKLPSVMKLDPNAGRPPRNKIAEMHLATTWKRISICYIM